MAKRNFEFILSGSNNDYIPLDAIVTNELTKVKSFNETYLKLVEDLKSEDAKKIETKPFDENKFNPEIILLGTTCALPSKYRNNSSILIKNEKNNTSNYTFQYLFQEIWLSNDWYWIYVNLLIYKIGVMLDAGDGTYF